MMKKISNAIVILGVKLNNSAWWPLIIRFGTGAFSLSFLLMVLTFATVPGAQIPRWMPLTMAAATLIFACWLIAATKHIRFLNELNARLVTALDNARDNIPPAPRDNHPVITLSGDHWDLAADLIMAMCRFISERGLDGFVAFIDQEAASRGATDHPDREVVERFVRQMHQNVVSAIENMEI